MAPPVGDKVWTQSAGTKEPVSTRLLFVVLALSLVATHTGGASSPAAREPAQLLNVAFDKMFNYPSVRTIELKVFRNGRVTARREFDVAYRKFDGLGHTILRFRRPDYLRNNALLIIETESGSNDTWLYQPEEGHPRRVSTYQKADSFYGTDLTYEDLENRRWDNYDVRIAGSIESGGRKFQVLEALPMEYSPYSRISVHVEVDSLAIGRIEFFKGEESVPTKTIHVELNQLTEDAGVFKPRRMRVEVAGRDWTTEVTFKRIEASSDITSKAFSTMRLQAEGEDLFRMLDRSKH